MSSRPSLSGAMAHRLQSFSLSGGSRSPKTGPEGTGLATHRSSWSLDPQGQRPPVLGGSARSLHLPDQEALAQALRSLGGPVGPTVVVDTETGGLGDSRVCVAGIAWVEGPDVAVMQWAVGGMGDEASLLDALVSHLVPLHRAGCVLVTFNGASFDLPLLRARCQRNRIDASVFGGPQLDLLHIARRLYRGRVPNCRLSTLERECLGLRRAGDLPGHLVPLVFERFFEAPEDPSARRDVERVVEHNHVDLISLFGLLARLGRDVTHPDGPESALRAARHALHRGDEAGAMRHLESIVADPAGGPRSCVHDAALLLADRHRRRGNHREAAALWSRVCAEFPGDPEAHEALAKHLEHRVRDPGAALSVAAASRCPTPARLDRLRRKLERRGQAGALADPR